MFSSKYNMDNSPKLAFAVASLLDWKKDSSGRPFYLRLPLVEHVCVSEALRWEFQATLYLLNTALLDAEKVSYLEPLTYGSLIETKRKLEQAFWGYLDEKTYISLPSECSDANAFETLVNNTVESKSLIHPLFDFLETKADLRQLREFIFQETPFDIHFVDIVAMLLPGLRGKIRLEISKNFWDEMGQGKEGNIHQNMRLDLMRALDIPEVDGFSSIEQICVEELALANLYLSLAQDRTLFPEIIGVLVATELAVPGRIEKVLNGFRRNLIDEDTLRYLKEHVTVDLAHGQGWLKEVVLPFVSNHPQFGARIFRGVKYRLHLAGAVADRLHEILELRSSNLESSGGRA